MTTTPLYLEDLEQGLPNSNGMPRSWFVPGIAFAFGIALCACGVAIMGSRLAAGWLPEGIRQWLEVYVNNPDAVFLGVILAILGALTVGWLGKDVLSGVNGGISAPVLRIERIGLIAIGIGGVSLILVCWHLASSQYSHWDILLFYAGLAVVGFGINRLDKGSKGATAPFGLLDLAIAAGLALLTVPVLMAQLTNWFFAWVGDEGAFYGVAADLAGDKLIRGWNAFSLQGGVYGIHPLMDSAWQSMGMRLFGIDVFGWRMSEVLLQAATGIVIYLAGKTLFGRLAGISAGLAVGTNHYAMDFGRIGYNNVHTIFWVALVILMMALAWRTQRAVYLFGTGVALGLCFYTYAVAILSWPVAGLLLLIALVVKRTRRMWVAGLLLLAGFAVAIIPASILTPLDYWLNHMLNFSVRQAAPGGIFNIVQQELLRSLVVFWSNTHRPNHFVGGPLADYATGILLLIGLGVSFFRLKAYPERLLATWFVLGLVLVAMTSYTAQPALTRLLFLLPAVALLAGLGAHTIGRVLITRLRLDAQITEVVLAAVLLVAIPGLNLKQLLIDSPAVVKANRQVMLIKALQEWPNNLLVEIAPQPDENIEVLLRMYPDLRDRYAFMNPDKLQPEAGTVEGRAPVYFLSQENQALVQPLSQRLTGYTVIEDVDGPGLYRVWLFSPAIQGP